MPVRCEYIMSSCRPVPYREPRKPPSTSHPAWRFSTMHLKPYPKFQKELKLESNADGMCGLRAGQQGALRSERPARRPRSPEVVRGKGSDGRQPLSILSTNTLCKGPTPAPKAGADWRRKGTSYPVPLLLLSSEPEQEGSLTLYQGDGADGQLDIWAVIKPGNTKEKIAIFTGQQCGQSSAPANLSTEGIRADVGPANPRTVSMKAKGCWEVEGSTAKRRKRSAEPDKRCCPERLSQGGGGAQREAGEGEGEGEGKTLSVVEMVAYMEQRANKPQVDCTKPLHPRTSGPATTPRVGSLPPAPCLEERPERPEALEGREEEGESVRVLDMVAKLESECLKRQSERECSSGGGLSRNNSLRRSVCRVLLAGPGSEVGSGSAPPQPEPIARESRAVEQYHESTPPPSAESRDVYREETEGSESAAKPCMQVEQDEEASRGGSSRAEHREEPLPGMLFFSTQQEQQLDSAAFQDCLRAAPRYDREEDPGSKQDVEEREVVVVSELEASAGSPERVPFPLRKLVSHRFLEMRFKIQLLLEPQQYMALLPHHIIVKIFSLLPTQTLAALKCTCHYFKFIIESYGVRPADSRWVCDPRYRDDPCKQCKRRYGRGDVSLCRWHHKPYCQALPFGPGYWMCCHGLHKDTPGCNVGLHDNRWVPAFHSINMPIYKKARESEEDS